MNNKIKEDLRVLAWEQLNWLGNGESEISLDETIKITYEEFTSGECGVNDAYYGKGNRFMGKDNLMKAIEKIVVKEASEHFTLDLEKRTIKE